MTNDHQLVQPAQGPSARWIPRQGSAQRRSGISLREGAVLDKDLRKKVHPVPEDLKRSLPSPPNNHRYVAIGGHVSPIDNHYQVKSVIHLH
jgi:hypothetical protein